MIDGLTLALQFLTRIPIKKMVDFNRENLATSICFFPLVGLVVGGLGGLFYYLFAHINPSLGSFFAVFSMIVITGGLHLDGLSDTCDGFLSYRDRERTLEIMTDSRIGAFGVIAIVLDILLKYILLSSLEGKVALLLGLAGGNSRLLVAYLMATKEAAKGEGIGYEFYKSQPKKYALIGGLVYLILILLIRPIYLIPLLISFLVGQVISRISYKKISGLSGDVYGAIIEIGEIVSLLMFLLISTLKL